MKIKAGRIITNHGMYLRGRPVGISTTSFEYTNEEREYVIYYCQAIWRDVMEKVGNPNFTGIIRFDLIPCFVHESGDDFGLRLNGLYEINTASPECAAAFAAVNALVKGVKQADIFSRLVKRIQCIFGNRKIYFLMSDRNALIKSLWGGIYLRSLQDAGLNIVSISTKDVIKKSPRLIWRWGDIRENGESQYSPDVTQWLWEHSQKEHVEIFNTILPDNKDPGRKNLLLKSKVPIMREIYGNNEPLNFKGHSEIPKWNWAVENKDKLVLKPDGGCSGANIFFGEYHNEIAWLKILKNCNHRGYSLWELKPLSETRLCGQSYAIDLNPAFFAHDDKLYYLYTICRIGSFQNYQKNKTMNVAKGAGMTLAFI